MPMVYDNWERLVNATLDREKLRQLALAPSRETSFNSSISSSSSNFNSAFDFLSDFSSASFNSASYFQSGSVTDRVVEAAENAESFKQECAEIKSKAENLAGLLRQVNSRSNDLYERPRLRIIPQTELVLEKALKLLLKCRPRRVFNDVSAAAFRKISSELDESIADLSFLLSFAYDPGDETLVAIPPICSNDPIVYSIWWEIAILYTGSLEDRACAAAGLASLAKANDRNGKLIIKEDGVRPLLKLMEEGRLEGKENAARVIRLLGKDPKSVEHIIDAGACQVFVEILKQGPMKAQGAVAWAVSEFTAHYPKCQQIFVAHNIIPLLVDLASETNLSLSGEMEDPATKAHIKTMASKALWQLAKGNYDICLSIRESRALLYFAALLKEGPKEAQYNSAMALMEITAMAEKDVELGISAFDQNLPAWKAVVDQLLGILEKAEPERLFIPCIKIIGNLATTFNATEARMMSHLVKSLNPRNSFVSREICIMLTKFACSQNAGCINHSKAIVDAGGAKHLIHLLYFGKKNVRNSALILLAYIIKHVPQSEQLAKVELLIVLEWAWNKSSLRQDKDVEMLLTEAKERLETCISISRAVTG